VATGRFAESADLKGGVNTMAVARVTELSATSPKSFDDAIQQGLERATKTLRNVKSAWIKEMRVVLENDKVSEYQVNILVTFVLDT
jgi:flavin-binding protein dodecin